MATSKIKPPAPIVKGSPSRLVAVPPTVQEIDQPSVTGPLDKGRSDFRNEKFLNLIKQKGYFLVWRKALLCPCVSPETEQPDINCTDCDGSGFIYIDPQDIQGIMSGFDRKDDIYRTPGHWLEGSSQLSVEPQYRLGYRDSVEMKDSVMVFNEWLKKNDREGVRSSLADGVDSARYRILNAVAFAAKDGANLIRLKDDVHFQITSDGLIKWTRLGNQLLEDGQQISAHYEFHPVWIVISHPNTLRDSVSFFKKKDQTVISLPLRAVVSLDYLNTANSLTETKFAPATGKK